MVLFQLSCLALLVVFSLRSGVHCGFEFTNIICSSLDKEFLDIEACFLKSKNRTYKFLTVRTKIHQLPFNKYSVRIEVLKRLNGYKPFLYNFSADACQFLNGRRNMLLRFFFELFSPYSNMNHSCPYNHNIFVEKLPISFLNHQLTAVLPVPEGDYLVHSVHTISGKERLDLKVFVRIY